MERMPVISPPRMIAWEITRRCNLLCAHCRASAEAHADDVELSTGEGYRLIDDIAALGRPTLILTGGEPLLRDDAFELAQYAVFKGLKVCLGTNGTLITEDVASKMKQAHISRISVSLDFPLAELQDRFRGIVGAFDEAIHGIRNAMRAGIEVQINCTITKMNLPYLESVINLAMNLGAVSFHPFLMVPTGRGKGLKDAELTPGECEGVLHRIAVQSEEKGDKITFRPTCAPFYYRIAGRGKLAVDRDHPSDMVSRRGCLAGYAFCFVSHKGEVQGCGYLDCSAGNVRQQGFAEIWQRSPLFTALRDPYRLKGKCGYCEYRYICGGCRARAYERTGDFMEAEPFCVYEPKVKGTLR